MKQIIRIPFGIMFCPIVLFVGTFIWLFEEDMGWWEDVGTTTWYLASGQWNKLPE